MKPSRKEMTKHIATIHQMAYKAQWSEIDTYILDLVKTPSKYTFVLVLRCIFSFRDELSHWKPIRKLAIEYLLSENIPPENVLHGLLEES